jgi:tRNA wybutosine-synthesizing protein 1
MIPSDVGEILRHQHYRVVGNHSAVKLCLWTKKSLRGEGFCYKQQFYGVQSHRCLQMTPAVSWCTHRCVFCWRDTAHTLGTMMAGIDDPEEIIDKSIEAQRVLLSGFGGLDIVDKRRFEEARNPNQVAISLSGEPTIYPKLSGLIEGFHKRGATTFLVSNGTLPDRLKALDTLPTQLYVSVVAPDEGTYLRVCDPISASSWNRIQETLELFPSLDTRKVVRITLVKGLNMSDAKGYAKLIGKAEPDYVEVKAYMFIGGSRKRLTLGNMPSPDEVRAFSEELATELGYFVKDEKRDSRVVLLSKKE